MVEAIARAVVIAILVLAPLATLVAVVQVFTGPRIISLLIFRYLLKRRIAWVSLIAVMLCTMMVLVVISVMGGWLRMFRETNHGLYGDLSVYRSSLTGFAHYQDMINEIRKLPEVKAAAPVVKTYGLINIKNVIRNGVQVIGFDLKQMQGVNDFSNGLHFQKQTLLDKAAATEREAIAREKRAAEKDALSAGGNTAAKYEADFLREQAARLHADADALRRKADDVPSFAKPFSDDTYRAQLPQAKTDVSKWPGMIVGTGVVGLEKDDKGELQHPDVVFHAWVRLTPLVPGNDVGVSSENMTVSPYWIVDDSRTQVFQVDANTVYVPFDKLQRDLGMDAGEGVDINTGQKTEARCNEIDISLKDPSKINEVKPAIKKIVDDMVAHQKDLVFFADELKTETWEERQADFLNAVEHEKSLLVVLFAIISLVSVFLIFCIFFMIVVEKTRDIGIIKSVGVTSNGVAAIFLGYGLVIGILGGGLGLLAGYLIVRNINQLHHWMGQVLKIEIWNAKTYLFDTIPNTVDAKDAVVIFSIAILSSVAGAILPAIRAGRMNPVEALRWE